jgi:hypothetical protein
MCARYQTTASSSLSSLSMPSSTPSCSIRAWTHIHTQISIHLRIQSRNQVRISILSSPFSIWIRWGRRRTTRCTWRTTGCTPRTTTTVTGQRLSGRSKVLILGPGVMASPPKLPGWWLGLELPPLSTVEICSGIKGRVLKTGVFITQRVICRRWWSSSPWSCQW